MFKFRFMRRSMTMHQPIDARSHAGKVVGLMAAVLLAACTDASPTGEATAPGIDPQFSSFDGSEWSAPVHLGPIVNSSAGDQHPTFSPDGLSLYFTSGRSGGLGGLDIWVSHRAALDAPWEAPQNLGPPTNTPNSDSAPTFSSDGHLMFFQSDRPGGLGRNDIYVSRRTNTHDDFNWGDPVHLGEDVNTAAFEGGVKYLPASEAGQASFYFGRGPTNSDLDIYYVGVRRDGSTVGPAVLSELSQPSPVSDGHASVRHDGREVIFFSNRSGGLGLSDLWVSSRRSVHEPWSTPVNLGSIINSTATDLHPSLSHDGRTLLFASDRPGGLGNSDIWMSTRTPSEH